MLIHTSKPSSTATFFLLIISSRSRFHVINPCYFHQKPTITRLIRRYCQEHHNRINKTSDAYYEDMSDDFIAEQAIKWFKEANERALQAEGPASPPRGLAIRSNKKERLLFYSRLIRSRLTRSSSGQSHNKATIDHYQDSVAGTERSLGELDLSSSFHSQENFECSPTHGDTERTNYEGGSGSSVEQKILSPLLPLPLHMDEDYHPPKRQQRFECWRPWHFVSSVSDKTRTELSRQGINAAITNFTKADHRAIRKNILCEHRCKPSDLRICWTFADTKSKLN